MKLLITILLLLPFVVGRTLTTFPMLNKFFSGRRRKASKDPQTSREMIEQNSRLLDLPDEILINIVGHLEYEELLAARRVSTHLQALAEPRIYREYNVNHATHSERLADQIDANPMRASWLRSVLVSTKFSQDDGLWRFPDQLRQMRNLKHLVLETPDCNAKTSGERVNWIDLQQMYEEILSRSTLAIPIEERVLGQLESITMHLVDDNNSLYRLPKYSSVFLHPTLKSLTLSCACTDFPKALFPRHRKYKRCTALEHLHLEECDVDPDSLELLLTFPQALKSLKLSEGTRYDSGYGPRQARIHMNMRPGHLSDALTCSVGDTLEKLDLSLGFKNTQHFQINFTGRALDLRRMTRLTDLSLSWDSLTLVCRRPSCDHEIYRRLPESIETLRVFSIPVVNLRGGPLIPLRSCVFKQKAAHGLPNLSNVVYRYEYQAPRGRREINRPGAATVSEVIRAYLDGIRRAHDRRVRMYKNSGVRLTVEVEVTPSGFIPPYLNNEEHPVVETYWDSDRVNLAVEQQSVLTSGKPPAPDGTEDEESDDEVVDITIGGRRISQIIPHMEDLLNFMIMQPAQGMPT